MALLATSCRIRPPAGIPEFAPGIGYTNQQIAKVPWSIHLVRIDRSYPDLEFRTTHAWGLALGLSLLVEQVESLPLELGTPLAAVNGDYYQMAGKPYPGDPRGLHVVEGELLSAPIGGVSFWIDAAGRPRATNVASRFAVHWPDGETTPFGLDELRKTNAAVLYTPAVGPSTRTTNGLELVLEPAGEGPWLPLRIGQTLNARVRDVVLGTNAVMEANDLVLSFDWELAATLPTVEIGMGLRLSFETMPDLRGVQTAISGGPMLVRNGKRVRWKKWQVELEGPLPYELRSMSERHPRTAIGWNDRYFYLFEVDGRQKKLSAGMTLSEVTSYFIDLGCTEVMNLDGGGSATMWCNGSVVNSPSEKFERDIANALIVVRKPKLPGASGPADSRPAN